jgi:hypothetical protein
MAVKPVDTSVEESKDGAKEGRRGGVVPPILNVEEEMGEEVVEEEEEEEEEEEATSEGVKEKSGTMVAKQESALDEAGVKEAEDPAKKEETTLLALLNVLLNEPLNVLLNVPPFDGKNLDLGPVGLMAPKLANTSRRPIGEDRRTEGLAYIRASAAAKASAAEEIRGRLERAVLDQSAPLAP